MISALGSALAFDWWFFVVMRLIGGIAVGGSSVVSPMYNAFHPQFERAFGSTYSV